MKRLWWVAFAVVFSVSTPLEVAAMDTTPSTPGTVKVSGPLLITAHSFSGHSLRFVQIFNSSGSVVSLDGWKISAESAMSQQTYATLQGKLAPGKYATIANNTALPTATFIYSDAVAPTEPLLLSISLQAPSELGILNETVSPTVTTTTPRVSGSPATFYFTRNISTSTGNYLTTFSAFVPGTNYAVTSDILYEAPVTPLLQIVEIFPDSPMCSPVDDASLCRDYVKMKNISQDAIDLSVYRIRTGAMGQAVSLSNTAALSGILAPSAYISVPITLSASGSWVWLEDQYGTTMYDLTLTSYPSNSGHDGEAWSYHDADGAWSWNKFPRASNEPNYFPEPIAINTCSNLAVNEIAANIASEGQFIEIINHGADAVDMTGCILQTNRSTTVSHVFGSEVLQPGEYRVVYIKDTPLTLTKTTTGTVYILSSDGTSEVSSASYDNLSENTSWSLVDGVWVQTYNITPNSANIWVEFPACEVGYERNIATQKCNKVATQANNVTDCGEGKIRNPDTNRCRNIISTQSVLASCAVNQERNPDTNRCRLISSTSGLSPCAANQERNPETNRCRNKKSSVQADFPVEAVASSAESTLGWWAFGGVGMLAVGYAGWEWRQEVMRAIRKVGRFLTGRA